MWYVYKECNVYGEDYGREFDNYEDALKYYEEQRKSEDVCRGYATLYLFKTLATTSKPMKDSSEFDFIEDTCEIIPNNNPRIKMLSNGIKEYGQKWKLGDIGVVQDDNDDRIYFTINGNWCTIYKGHRMYDGKYEFVKVV